MNTKVEHQHGARRCHRCGAPVEVGQDVVTIARSRKRGKSGYRLYHKACFDELLH